MVERKWQTKINIRRFSAGILEHIFEEVWNKSWRNSIIMDKTNIIQFFNRKAWMAEIIELQSFSKGNKGPRKHQLPVYNSQTIRVSLIQKLHKLSSNKSNLLVQVNKKGANTIELFCLIPIFLGISATVRISLDFLRRKISAHSNFIKSNQLILINSSIIRRSFCKTLLKVNQEIINTQMKFLLNMHNGNFRLSKFSEMKPMQIYIEKLSFEINQFLSQTLRISNLYLISLLEVINILPLSVYLPYMTQSFKLRMRKQHQKMQEIKSHLALASVKLDAGKSQEMQNKHLNLKFHLEFSQKYEQKTFKDKRLFTENNTIQVMPEKQLGDSDACHPIEVIEKYKDFLQYPQAKIPSPGQNKFIFNTIAVTNTNVEINDIGISGGMSKLQVARLEFSYATSQNIVQEQGDKGEIDESIEQYTIDPPQNNETNNRDCIKLIKPIAIKVPKNQQSELGRQGMQKITHEKNIVTSFRTSSSAYLLKYYHSIQATFPLREYLLMDFVQNSTTLSNYIEIHRPILSIYSKLHILIHLVNAVRFIEEKDIVHMDLSLNNILVFKDYIVKIIDFGEAYLKKACALKYRPGHTIPFAPPQGYSKQSRQFTSKQDMFSYGMIFFRILFETYPYYFGAQNMEEIYRSKTYLEKLFFAPQKIYHYGNYQIMSVLLNLIMRCLNTSESQRPFPVWMLVILKELFFSLR